ncbi:hypothetical protein BMS77_02185 [Leuconostoc pseudomesenteroides]|uniref:Uncharacterized protein n=1 Tax=Leuconostoc pseudomesenteroides TaxID=33968 RepID=A0A1X0VE92_LEUPS|nr:hypothetical protein [Leuconostoc pseudomesenteroides]OQJ73349.1 hypothetical protein BMS77_02185 [Leuconostoc pseudomesenteroides]OQJ77551.1 hypothetical protein BMS83_01945 [Leuconostoc pseudomesenteroides]OQJ78206.1 hypothetical protein BMS82_03925 [Leuconostoc pseudomesenteroides]ORI37608.1 hypothetical protein BMR88_03640 [Leuconostoc pseudomesenteroides]ORI45995.1 hypothetical protein BMR94_04115 [Leuconostoc pseudomesenteroides]
MKIVSLQSVGLGAAYTRGDGEQIITPYGIYVGTTFLDSAGNYLDVTVTEINYQQGDFDAYGFEIYTVHTSDGHIRVLPADKYIAEWSEQS